MAHHPSGPSSGRGAALYGICSCNFLQGQLRRDDFIIDGAGLHQFSMGTYTNNTTVIQHDDAISIHDGAHTLSDDEHGGVSSFFFEGSTQPGIGLEVKRGEAVVKDVDFG